MFGLVATQRFKNQLLRKVNEAEPLAVLRQYSISTNNLLAGTIQCKPQPAAAKPPAKEIGTKQSKQQQRRPVNH